MKKTLIPIAIILVVLFLVSCTPGPNQLTATPGVESDVAGFWLGLWHGFIALFTFIVSLFNDNVSMYEVNNSGKLYNLGYLLGVMIFFSGGENGRCRWRR